LGDSISEGVIVRWAKEVGDNVEVDDVVAVVETDKVSVDIRSSFKGTLAEKFANIDEVVAVGARLCTVDGEGNAATTAGTPEPSSGPVAAEAEAAAKLAAAAAAPPAQEKAPATTERTPLIKFRGKRLPPREAQVSPDSSDEAHQYSPGALEFDQ
ncbi:unnamed protein product, partial [Phaeothamnion confervicola]